MVIPVFPNWGMILVRGDLIGAASLLDGHLLLPSFGQQLHAFQCNGLMWEIDWETCFAIAAMSVTRIAKRP